MMLGLNSKYLLIAAGLMGTYCLSSKIGKRLWTLLEILSNLEMRVVFVIYFFLFSQNYLSKAW